MPDQFCNKERKYQGGTKKNRHLLADREHQKNGGTKKERGERHRFYGFRKTRCVRLRNNRELEWGRGSLGERVRRGTVTMGDNAMRGVVVIAIARDGD